MDTKPSITELEVAYATDAARYGWGDRCYEYIARLEAAFARLVQDRADALVVNPDPLFLDRRVQLATLSAHGARVCIVRDIYRQQEWLTSSYGKGPLGKSLALYKKRIATVSHYSVSVLGKPSTPRP